jgi:hypothetical protein
MPALYKTKPGALTYQGPKCSKGLAVWGKSHSAKIKQAISERT